MFKPYAPMVSDDKKKKWTKTPSIKVDAINESTKAKILPTEDRIFTCSVFDY